MKQILCLFGWHYRIHDGTRWDGGYHCGWCDFQLNYRRRLFGRSKLLNEH